MYLLDTNVISELRKAKTHKCNKNVIAWAKKISPASLFISIITVLELEIGVLRIEQKDSVQGTLLRSWLDTHVLPAFSNRIINLDLSIAQRCAKLHIPNPKSDRDALIAATALVHGMVVVTRNTADFNKSGVELLNPWELAKKR